MFGMIQKGPRQQSEYILIRKVAPDQFEATKPFVLVQSLGKGPQRRSGERGPAEIERFQHVVFRKSFGFWPDACFFFFFFFLQKWHVQSTPKASMVASVGERRLRGTSKKCEASGVDTKQKVSGRKENHQLH